ncbi:MAG: sn-glycerol-1-phosphate dehydrogenase [Candidatus Nephthysia bennettiae]|uniref:Sn-glycerol-1-phosphate dehydrogenase n=1 Tax=Candidatus Nephthysia bennettiae TaxID=3127016 RepID=A0A934N3X4_9BACT|nr:sn-glycerol-1-phosphate dehydrogenase [Candidatus Dormibacteraeota bacterium]PZR95084.1 MAG: sn-glycerol-1-phosphate dehydrogenase [Candidatus Dormibacteraeota bacterium]
MNTERIQAALRNAADTADVVIGAGVLPQVDEMFGRSFGDQPAVVVADENTFKVAGEQVLQHLKAAGRRTVDPYIFPGRPTLHAEYTHIQELIESLRLHDAVPVAVGSGSLNDIVKRASYECKRRYMAVGTAASMDGYTAFGAAITKEGYKQTMTCPAPRAMLAELDTMRNAPPRMTSSGYADLLGKVPAGADWLVADALEVEKVNAPVWSLVQGPLRQATGSPAELHAGDEQALDSLIEGLIMSGLAMQAAASSRPASGAEHQFSHLWEMEGLGYHDEPPLSHGFKVGVGSIAIAALYEQILRRDLSSLDVQALVSAWPSWEEVEQAVRAAHKTPGLDKAAIVESRIKYISADKLAERLELLSARWPELRKRIEEQLLTADQLRQMLGAAGCPTHPSEIGLSLSDFKDTYYRSRMIRRRYTVLDLATEAGILSECVDELFAPGGFWARDPAAKV